MNPCVSNYPSLPCRWGCLPVGMVCPFPWGCKRGVSPHSRPWGIKINSMLRTDLNSMLITRIHMCRQPSNVQIANFMSHVSARRSTATSITTRTLSHQPSDLENTDFMNQAACSLRSFWVFTALTQPLHNSYMYFMISLYLMRILPYPAETHNTSNEKCNVRTLSSETSSELKNDGDTWKLSPRKTFMLPTLEVVHINKSLTRHHVT